MLISSADTMEDSTKWRTLTVQQLIGTGAKTHDTEVMNELRMRVTLDVLNPLGYTVQESQQKKFDDLLTAAVKLAQVLAGQRAVFSFGYPDISEDDTKQGDDNANALTNIDDAGCFDGPEDEETGRIWFLIQPALVKNGTGVGQKLDERTILRKAYVQLIDESMQI